MNSTDHVLVPHTKILILTTPRPYLSYPILRKKLYSLLDPKCGLNIKIIRVNIASRG